MGLFCIGDVHGDLKKTKELLREAEIIDEKSQWAAGDSTFVFIGDLVDRGPYSVECILFVMNLQKEAKAAGGEVVCVLGNHDLSFISCLRQMLTSDQIIYLPMYRVFLSNGGTWLQMEKAVKHPEILDWYLSCPMLFKKDKFLFQHADSMFYAQYGQSVEEINEKMKQETNDDCSMLSIYCQMCNHREWSRHLYCDEDLMCDAIDDYMELLDVDMIIHGHTPFCGNSPMFYYDNRIINIDGALSCGYGDNSKNGFVLKLK